MKRYELARRVYRAGWLLWIPGTVLITLGWFHVVSPAVVWVGFALSLFGLILQSLSHLVVRYPRRTEQAPTQESDG